MHATLCHSERFVQDGEKSPLAGNLAALWVAQPAVAGAVDECERLDRVTVSIAKDGQPTATAIDADGRSVQLHSRYAPAAEATKLVDGLKLEGVGAVFVMGLGLGHHLKDLYERTGDTVRIWIFEPNLNLIRAAIEHLDLSKALGSGRVRLIQSIDRADLTKQFSADSAAIVAGNCFLEHRPSMQLSTAFFDEARAAITDLLGHCRTQITTILQSAKRTAENITKNLPLYLSTPGLDRLANAFAGKPAIIVSAGPSLRKNKHQLAAVKDNAVLISVQTTLQVMLEMGIEPHFVTSIDFHEICRKFFERVPATCRTELVAEPKATDEVFDVFPGPVTLLGNEFAEDVLREARVRKPRIRASATVAHLAFYLAEHMGCDPIIFVGQDLGFSDGLFYTPGTTYDDVWRPELGRFCTVEQKQWEQIARDKPILKRVPDYRGRPTYSEERMWSYLQQFERDFAASRAKIIDATEGGVAKRGTTIMPLAEAIARFCSKPLGKSVPAHPGQDLSKLSAALPSLRSRLQEATQIADIARQTLPLVEQIVNAGDDQRKVNQIIAQIDPLRAKMNEYAKTYDLVLSLSQKSEFTRFQNDLSIGASKLDGVDLQRRQAKRDVDNVKAVLAAAEEFERLMQSTLERFESLSKEGA